MSQKPFSGVITAIATPFTQQNKIDPDAFKKILTMQKNAGINGVVVNGTTGESPTLSDEERISLVKTAMELRSDHFHVYVGTGSNCTKHSIETSKKIAELNVNGSHVDGVMAVVPYYNKPSQEGMLRHFTEIARAVPETPVCLYNVPGRTVAALSCATFISCAKQNKNIVAIKEAAGDIKVVTEMRRALEKEGLTSRVSILSGDDPTYGPALLCGASGVISVTTHVIPRTMVQMREAMLKGDAATLMKLHLASYPINTELFCAPNPVPLKYVLAKNGWCQNVLRLPLTPVEEKEALRVDKAIADAVEKGIQLF